MRFTPTGYPKRDSRPEVAIEQLGRWALGLFQDLALLLNGRVSPDDQFDAVESEQTFAQADTPQLVTHGLGRVPDRVECVRADQAGIVYVIARTTTTVEVAATVAGTYRIRVS